MSPAGRRLLPDAAGSRRPEAVSGRLARYVDYDPVSRRSMSMARMYRECCLWILNPDLVVTLRLIKEGNNWTRLGENFASVVREIVDEKGEFRLIEIKREFLMDYLAARILSLRLSYYRQRVENVAVATGSDAPSKGKTIDGTQDE